MATFVSSTNYTKSRYTAGGVTDIYPNRLGWWEANIFQPALDDISYTVTPGSALRADTIANDVYGNPAYSWLVLLYNTIVDSNEELVAGATLTLPTPARLNSVVSQKTGGNVINS